MKYNAFISYRHLETDRFVAETLHRTLESFKLPKSLHDQCENHEISRVFRDKDELPLSSDLSAPIDEALRESEFLIVICTPRLKESRWCLREIETFKQLHGREKIFAVLASGEPEESFPEALLQDTYEEPDENGNPVTKIRLVEPLAADVRGKSKREIKKKIKEESIRLVAPMFGLSYDDLKQRHREREIKRKICVASVIAGFFTLFGVVSTTMALALHRQNLEIKQNYAQSLSAESEMLFAQGNLYEAREKADMALSYADTDVSRHAYDTAYGKNASFGSHVLSDCYAMENGAEEMCIAPDGGHLAVTDGTQNVVLIDTSSGEKVTLPTPAFSFGGTYSVFVSNEKLLYNTADGLTLYDYTKQTEQLLYPDFARVFLSDDEKMLAVLSVNLVQFYDTEKMELVSQVSGVMDPYAAVDFSQDGKLFAVCSPDEGYVTGTVFLMDPATGEILTENTYEGGCPISITCKEHGYAISLCKAIEEEMDTTENTVAEYGFDGDLIWQSRPDSTLYLYVDYCAGEVPGIFAVQPNRITLFDEKNGEIHDAMPSAGSFYLHDRIGEGRYALTTSDSDVVVYDAKTGDTSLLVNYDVHPTLTCAEAVLSGADLYIHFTGRDYISVYKAPEEYADDVVASDVETFSQEAPSDAVLFADHFATMYGSDEEIHVPKGEENSVIVHTPDKQYFVCYDDAGPMRMYHNGDDEPLYMLDLNTGMLNYVFFSEDGGWFAANYRDGALDIFDTVTSKPVISLEKDFGYVDDIIVLPQKDTVIVDTCYDTRILDFDFHERTTYQKEPDFFCVGYDAAAQALLVQKGNVVHSVPLNY